MSADDLEQRVTQLEATVEQLTELVDEDSPKPADQAFDATFGSCDKYDLAVVNRLHGREGEEFKPRQIVRMYQIHSGIRDKNKRKERAKDLVASDLFESGGRGQVRFVGSNEGGDSNE